MRRVKRNILLTPGPATTTDTVKDAQVVPDICPREPEFGRLMEAVAMELTRLVADPRETATVLFGGSGTAAVESILSSVVNEGTLLVLNNGAYGRRMCEIADAYGIKYIPFDSSPVEPVDLNALEKQIQTSPHKISHLAVVHHETTTGLLNDIGAMGQLCKKHGIDLIVDAISSFAAIPIQMKAMNISYLAASANKNLQGMPGVSFVIADRTKLDGLRHHKKRNYYLHLYDQYRYFEQTRQLRFTPPVQTLYALNQAIVELKREGVEKRYQRYAKSWQTLIHGINRLGLKHLVPEPHHSKLITSILEPDCAGYDFRHMHDYFYSRNITIYPGKLTNSKTFRIANIGDITHQEIQVFIDLLERYLNSIQYKPKGG
ncbi:2-aminoethylphosphonate aminotransferase [Kroppenstedtia eburnea]|uniref:2-aminoethylphosphonate aminotransferase n=1 Tax=Kroppenstedtia eburnea TaxID=714067 RepID=UPI00058E9790